MADEVPKFEDTVPMEAAPSFEDTSDIPHNQLPEEGLPEGEQGPSKTEALLRGGGQGLTAGFQDELSAALSALLPPTEVDKITGKGGYLSGMGDRYRQARDTFRKDNAEAQEAHPYVYGAGEIGGGILSTPLIPGGKAAQGASKLAKIGKGIVQGAEYGGAAGLGYSNAELTPDKTSKEDIEQAAKDVGKGAAIGGTFGGAATAAVEGGKGLIGILKNTKAAKSFSQGKAYGEAGENLMGESNRVRIEGERADQADKIASSMEALKGKISDPAAKKISTAVEGSLEQVGKDLGLQKQELLDFIQNQHDEVGKKIQQTYANAEANGVKVDAKELLTTIRDELQNTVFNSKVDDNQKARILKNLESYLLKEKMPLKFQSMKVTTPEGQPLVESNKLAGKNMSLDEVNAMKSQQEAGTLGDVSPDNASIETRKNPIFGESTVSKESQTITPPAEEVGPLAPQEALQARNYLGDEAAGLTGKPQTILAGGRKKLSDLISDTVGGDIKSSNEKYTTIKRIFDEIGEPVPEYVGPGELPPKSLNKLVDRMGKATTEGDKAEAARLFEALKTLDPEKATQLQGKLGTLSTQENALAGAVDKAPEKQLGVLKEQGLSTPELETSGKQIEDVASLQKAAGTPDQIEKARSLVDNLASSDVAKARDAEAVVKQIEQFDPDLANELRTKGTDISKKSALVSEMSSSTAGSPTTGITKRLINAMAKIPGKAGNAIGLAKNAVSKELGSITNPLSNLSSMIESSPGSLESLGFAPKYADRLRDAAGRGKSALSATNFILSQFPDYRETMDKYQAEHGSAQERPNTLGEPATVSPDLTKEANTGSIKSDQSEGSMPIGEPSMKPQDQNVDLSPGSTVTPNSAQPNQPPSQPAQPGADADKARIMQIVQVGASRLLQNPDIAKSQQVKSLISRTLNENSAQFQGMDQNAFLMETMTRVDNLMQQLKQLPEGASPEDRAAAAVAIKNLTMFKQGAMSKVAK